MNKKNPQNYRVSLHADFLELKTEKALYSTIASEICVGDFVFDFCFKKIISKKISEGIGLEGYNLEAVDADDNLYSGFVYGNSQVNIMDNTKLYLMESYGTTFKT